MTSPRARWLAARTRNAARHGLIIAGVGTLVMIATLLTFVLLPRQADRTLSAALAALPPARDTLSLLVLRVGTDSVRAEAQAERQRARVTRAEDAMLLDLVGAPLALAPDTLRALFARDTLLRGLANHLLRARETPLVESYRVLADAPALAREPRVAAAAVRLRDSIESVAREREALAAQRGPDARYAALTARMTALGERLVQLAAGALRVHTDSLVAMAARAADTTTALPSADSGTRTTTRTISPDSAIAEALRTLADSASSLDRALADARRFNAVLAQRRDALRARTPEPVPPLAMLLASLVLGMAVGFAVALWREVRRPRVGDARELEELTRSRVIVHARPSDGRALATPLAARVLVRRGRRLRDDDASAPALSPTADAWPLLHLTISDIGDMSRQVQIVADRPVLAGAVGLNLAVVAARESRATALVDAALRAGALVPLLPATALMSSALPSGTAAEGGRDRRWATAWDASRALPLGRDASVTLILPRRARAAEDGDGADVLGPLLRRFDFTVFVSDTPNPSVVPTAADVVLCARLGATPLAWVTRAVRAVEGQGRRIRAVVLWADDVPLAGSRASG